jgi:membrane protein DedA with SNARE-associated domain
MNQGKTLLWGGLIYGLFVTTAVYWLGAYLEVSASLPVRVLFALGVGVLASLVFLFAYIAGKRRDKD